MKRAGGAVSSKVERKFTSESKRVRGRTKTVPVMSSRKAHLYVISDAMSVHQIDTSSFEPSKRLTTVSPKTRDVLTSPGRRPERMRGGAPQETTERSAALGTERGEIPNPSVSASAAERMEGVSETTRSRRSEVAELAERIVDTARTGFDERGRKLLTLTVEVPGRGLLEIRMRKDGRHVRVELQADSPAFGRMLRRSRKELKHQSSQRGVILSSVKVTR